MENTDEYLMHSALCRSASAVMPVEVRKGKDVEHAPERDLNGCHQDYEEGYWFERLDSLVICKMIYLLLT